MTKIWLKLNGILVKRLWLKTKSNLLSKLTLVWRQPLPSAVLRSRQRAGLRSWSSACGPRKRARCGRDRAEQWLSLPPPGAALAKFTTWSLKGVVGTLGTYPGRGLGQRESQPARILGTNHRLKCCRSPTLLTEANAVRSTVFNDRNLSSTDCRGSKGSSFKAVRTEGRSQEGTRWGRRGFNLLAPLRNLTTKSCFPTDLPSTASWCVAIAATYTLRVEGDSLRSNPSCRKESTTKIGHLRKVFPAGRTTNRRTGSTSACKRVL